MTPPGRTTTRPSRPRAAGPEPGAGRPALTTAVRLGHTVGESAHPGGTVVKKFVVLLLVLLGLGAIVAVAIKATQE